MMVDRSALQHTPNSRSSRRLHTPLSENVSQPFKRCDHAERLILVIPRLNEITLLKIPLYSKCLLVPTQCMHFRSITRSARRPWPTSSKWRAEATLFAHAVSNSVVQCARNVNLGCNRIAGVPRDRIDKQVARTRQGLETAKAQCRFVTWIKFCLTEYIVLIPCSCGTIKAQLLQLFSSSRLYRNTAYNKIFRCPADFAITRDYCIFYLRIFRHLLCFHHLPNTGQQVSEKPCSEHRDWALHLHLGY